jgi:predicted nucleic acid-binding protein
LTRRLSDVPDGAHVFVDANIFVYHFTGVSADCSRFLARCEQGSVAGLTGAHILLEVLHRLMMVEAVIAGLVPPGNVARKLRDHPEVVTQLSRSEEQADLVPRLGVRVMPVGEDILVASRQYRSSYGLMVNDSVTMAMARQEGVEAIASSDKDFLRIPRLHVYRPGDITAAAKRKR